MIAGSQFRQKRESLGLSQAKLAEITGIPQHLLSAFELGKSSLPPSELETIALVLSNGDRTLTILNRTKRYREHKYDQPEVLPERKSRSSRTAGNEPYLRELHDLYVAHAAGKPSEFSALSLFAGCGGFSLGFSAAGFEIKGFVEIEAPLRAIYRRNFPSCREIAGDVSAVTTEAMLDLRQEIGSIDVIIGGPPCQGFSLSGKRRTDDPRNELFRHYLRFVDVFRPKIAVMENVRLLTSMKNSAGGLVLDDIKAEFVDHGYKVACFDINAKAYGVPQHRERVLFVAVRGDLDQVPSIPDGAHGDGGALFSGNSKYRTFADACSDLEFLESGGISEDPFHKAVSHPAHVIEWLWDVPEGSSAHENADPAMRPPSGYNTTYKRQVWNEPGATVQTTFGMISGCRNVHPIATRSLTVREAARLQSFPDEFKFIGTVGSIRTGIGNAVPPLLSYALARHIKEML